MKLKVNNNLLQNTENNKVLQIKEVFEVYRNLTKGLSQNIESNGIDFSQIDYCVELRLKIYLPSEGVVKKATCEIYILDFFYNRYVLSYIPYERYYVVNNSVLVFSEENLEEIKQMLTVVSLGPVNFSSLATLRNKKYTFLDYEENDNKCLDISIDNKCDLFPEVTLYPYQKIGVDWLQSITKEGVGCILADEMGLGKTIQIIYLIRVDKSGIPSLIIAPNSLLENWRREINKFAPKLKIYTQKGNNRECYYKNLLKYDVIITSYETAVNDIGVIGQIKWQYLILDEAQAIKNPKSLRSKRIREFDKKAGIAVTGTPFENHMTDVWSLFDFCFPQLLGNERAFNNYFKDDFESASKLEKIITPLILRRKVKDVQKDLPSVVLIPEVLEMGDLEKSLYDNLRKDSLTKAETNKKYPIQLLTKLRLFCALPTLLDEIPDYEHPEKESIKLTRLIEILEEIFSLKEKVLIFTHFIKIQDVLMKIIEHRFYLKPYLLRGDVPLYDRQRIVDDFSEQSGFQILILNPTVGGTGLNITAANHVIFYTLGWNPAQERQCLARSLRIGQEKTVFEHRLFYCDTVEEFINDKLNKKTELAEKAIIGINGSDYAEVLKALQKSPLGASNNGNF